MKSGIWAAFIVLTVVWGASFLWIKIAVEDIGPYTLVALRMLFGLLGLLCFVVIQRPPVPRDAKTWRALLILGLLNSALPWLLISWAEQTIDSALATVLNSTVPLFTILIAHVYLRDDRMTRQRVAGLLIGFGGVLVLMQRSGGVTDAMAALGVRSSLPGQLAMLAATLLYAISAVHARRNLRHTSALVQAFYSMLVATALMWIALPVLKEPLRMPSGPQTWSAILWLGVLGAGVASYLFYFLLHAVGPTRASFVTYTIPIVGVSLGVIVLKEALDVYLFVGTVLIVSGVWVVNRR
jgi:drug/metabolite transporter (DMT)-like permease